MSRNLIFSIAAYFTSICINFALTPFILKSLGDVDFGLLMLIIAFTTQASVVMGAFNGVATRFIAKSYFDGDFGAANGYYAQILVVASSIGAAVLVVALLANTHIASALGAQGETLGQMGTAIVFYAATFVCSLFYGIINTKVFVTGRLYINYCLAICNSFLYATSVLTCFVLFTAKMSYVAAAAFAVNAILTALMLFVTSRLKVAITFKLTNFSTKNLWNIVKSGCINAFNSLPNLILHSCTLLFCNQFLGAAEASVIYLSKVIPLSLETFCGAVAGSVGPRILKLYTEGKIAELLAFLRFAMKVFGSMAGVVLAVFISVGERFFAIWLPFKDAAEIAEIYRLSLIFLAPLAVLTSTYVLFSLNLYTNQLRRPFFANLTMCCAVVASQVAWLSLGGGLYGVAACVALCLGTRALCFDVANAAWNLRLPFTTFYPTILRCIGVIAGLAVVFSLAENLVASRSAVAMLALCAGFGVVGLLGCFVLLFDVSERMIIKNKINHIKNRVLRQERQ